jgi:hypothetical protein
MYFSKKCAFADHTPEKAILIYIADKDEKVIPNAV